MTEPHGHDYDDHRVCLWRNDSHRWRKGDGRLGSNGSEWDPEPGCVQMYNSMAPTTLSDVWGATSRGMFGGRYELNFGGLSAISYTSRIRILRCHEMFSLLVEMVSERLMPNVVTYSAAISACGKGQKPQQALHLLQELQLRGLLPNVITYSAAISACATLRLTR